MAKKFNKSSWLKAILRRASLRYPPRNDALKRARVARGDYCCEMCGGIFKRKEVQLDHSQPVIDLDEGCSNIGEYVERLFCDTDNFSVLCVSCHGTKTAIENQYRTSKRKKNEKKGI